ncbi:MAG: formyltransferase family protein [Granulosicoccaceae bacterium]
MKLAITAGFDKSLPALLMADRLRADGHSIGAVIVVTPYSIKRVREMLLSRGVSGIKKAMRKMLKGVESNDATGPNPLHSLKQEQQLTTSSLKAWCAEYGVSYHVVKSINDQTAVNAVRDAKAEMLVYGGGGILRKALIEAVDGKVINPHAGPLPEIRGMNAIEWATLLGERQTVTVHLIDTGIDTGRLIGERAVPVVAGDGIDTLRAKAVATGVCALTDTLKHIAKPSDIGTQDNPGSSAGRQCYPMSQALSELLATKLKQP